jgi:cytochrome c oxidase assembly protein subunit 11
MQDNSDRTPQNDLNRRNAKTAGLVFCVVLVMLGLAYASAPLYSLFCRVTGFGGTTQIAVVLPDKILDRTLTIRFDTNTASNLPWDFKPEILHTDVRLGEKGLANFITVNQADKPITGTALFNVTPLKAGKYFNKIQCFCFGEQILQPGQRVNMPVLFYVDPKMNEDPLMDDVSTITLSYTFYKIDTPELDKAWEAFYNSPSPENGGAESNRNE